MSYAELFKQQQNGIFKVKEIDVSEELPNVGKIYVKELNGLLNCQLYKAK